MKPCINSVEENKCRYCESKLVKFGRAHNNQRYLCKSCGKTQMLVYRRNACNAGTSASIVSHLIEGCGIRSIARLLKISATKVLSRIRHIASRTKKPAILTGRSYEVDEMKTYIGSKRRDCWIMYALDKQSGEVVDFKVGRRNTVNLQMITNTLLLSNCREIFTDRFAVYKNILPAPLHKTRRCGTNRIERNNLSLRTSLKRLNRKSICFSKSRPMLEACLRIYFWRDKVIEV